MNRTRYLILRDVLTPASVFSPKDLQGNGPATLDDAIGAVYAAGTTLMALVYRHLGVVKFGPQEPCLCAMGMVGVGFPARPIYIHAVDPVPERIFVFVARVLLV